MEKMRRTKKDFRNKKKCVEKRGSGLVAGTLRIESNACTSKAKFKLKLFVLIN